MDPYSSVVLFTILRRIRNNSSEIEYLLMPKINYEPSFPATKFRETEELYTSLERILNGDLGLDKHSFYPEVELPMLKNRKMSHHYPGLEKDYYLYPVEVSLTRAAWKQLDSQRDLLWYTLDEIPAKTNEPNILAIVNQIKGSVQQLSLTGGDDILGPVKEFPTMDALANRWARHNDPEIGKRYH
jgi:hypothetical protein